MTVTPLEPPPGLPFGQLGLVRPGVSAEVYQGLGQDGRPVTIAVLTPAGAADPAVRAAFLDLAGRNSFPATPGMAPVHAADLAAARPWAANYQLPDHVGVEAWPDLLPSQSGPEPAPLTPETDPVTPVDLTPVPEAGPSEPAQLIGSAAVPWGPPQPAPPAAQPGPPHPVPPAGPPGPPQPAVPATPWGSPQPNIPRTAPWVPPQPGPPRPTGSSNKGPLIVVIAGICAVTVLLAAAVVLAVRAYERRRPVASRGGPPAVSPRSVDPGVSPGVGPTASAGGGPGDSGAAKPKLRQVRARVVVGPTYAAGDPTYTMAFNGWPFAFRTGKTWGCLAGKGPERLADAKVWVCVDEGNAGARQKANIMLRPCPTTCTAAERASLNRDWFDEPARAKPVLDDRTSFVETARDANGFYSVDLSHFIPGTPGGPLKWQVGVFVRSPSETREVVQKLLNDVVSQAG